MRGNTEAQTAAANKKSIDDLPTTKSVELEPVKDIDAALNQQLNIKPNGKNGAKSP